MMCSFAPQDNYYEELDREDALREERERQATEAKAAL